MEEAIAALKRASPKVAAIIVVGWIATTLLEKEDLSLVDLLVFCLTLVVICAIYFFSPDIINRPPKE